MFLGLYYSIYICYIYRFFKINRKTKLHILQLYFFACTKYDFHRYKQFVVCCKLLCSVFLSNLYHFLKFPFSFYNRDKQICCNTDAAVSCFLILYSCICVIALSITNNTFSVNDVLFSVCFSASAESVNQKLGFFNCLFKCKVCLYYFGCCLLQWHSPL